MIGKARVTEMVAISLSKVTTRGVETTCASEDVFKNESTALTPSALRKPVPNPCDVLATTAGVAKTPLTKPGEPGVVTVAPPEPTVVVGGVGCVIKTDSFP